MICGSLQSQDVTAVHGVSISLAFPKKLRVLVSYDLHLRSHIPIKGDLALTPLTNLKVALFRQHLGASILKHYRAPLYSNITLSYGGLISVTERNEGELGLVPVFTTIYHQAPNTSYCHNFGFASSQMWQIGLTGKSHVTKVLHQQLGQFMFSVNDFYMTYYNDGGPVLSYFGDREDRYWTGGLVLGYWYRDGFDIHQMEVSFDKFTGFSKHAFEATGLLQVDNVIYKDIEQFSYNTGRMGIKYLNHGIGMGGSVNIWNIPFDLQDYLHRDVSNNPYHHKIENLYIDMEVYKIYGL